MTKKTKIALIEDDIAIVQMYRMKFEDEGFQVETAANGEVGLQLIEKFNPDIVLLDLMMPIMNGDEMLELLRQEKWGKDKKVIILTNMGENEASPRIRQLNINSFIVKSDMTPKQVMERVKVVLKQK